MMEFGILMIIFGFVIVFSGLYLVLSNKGDFTQVLLWKSNVKKMTKKEINYVGKVTMFCGLSPIISGALALIISESIIPVLVLIISFILLLILGIKIFK